MSDVQNEERGRTWFVFGLLLAIIGVLGLAELAALLPAAVRKIVLFSVAYGIVSGLIVSWIAADQRLSTALAVPLTGLLVVSGLLLIGYRSFDQLRTARLESLENASGEGFDKLVVRQLTAQNPELMETGFSDYLIYRLQPLGRWRQPWPAVFWGAEIAAAALAGAFVVSRRLTSDAGESNLSS